MPPRRAAHSHSGGSMSPISEEGSSLSTLISNMKTTAPGVERRNTALLRRTSHTTNAKPTPSMTTPSPTMHLNSLVPRNFSCLQCLIPDNDPFVHYSGVWLLNVGPQSSTSHSTTTPGSSISLKFNGSGIVVFGTVPASNDTVPPPSAVYFLDNNPPFPSTLPRAAMDIPHQALFATQQPLSNDEHHIVINITKTAAPFTFSGFFVFPSMETKDMEVGQPTTGPFSNITRSQPPSPSNSSSAVMQQTSGSSNSHRQGPEKSVRILIAVLVVIGVLLVAGGIFFFFWRRRAAKKRQQATRVSCPEAKKARPDTVYTSFTTTESILQNDPNFWSPNRSQRSNASRSEGQSRTLSDFAARRVTIDYAPPPLPPKAAIFPRLPLPPLPTNPG
ncbi:hypothetical protein CVT26_003850 [Gymnopilus dilepis]|uniref:Uncharacterized protein n=1 Tax=Gymnopilus dilepis TaxID=231916 RepID=A0A409YUX7_9AGAR|nr:hypothetical protein CVT26_003850 [Gymnopilus dilepis]